MSDLRLRISEGDDTVEDEDGTGGEATSSASSPGKKMLINRITCSF